MKLYRLQRTQTLPLSVEEAWTFFSSPQNLPSITPPWLNLAVQGEVPDAIYPGTVFHLHLTPIFGLKVVWITEITHVDPPHYFVDEQRFGPYRFWHHQHLFRPLESGTEMTDTVSYAMKYGPFGRMLHDCIIERLLHQIFDFRQRSLERIFQSDSQ